MKPFPALTPSPALTKPSNVHTCMDRTFLCTFADVRYRRNHSHRSTKIAKVSQSYYLRSTLLLHTGATPDEVIHTGKPIGWPVHIFAQNIEMTVPMCFLLAWIRITRALKMNNLGGR